MPTTTTNLGLTVYDIASEAGTVLTLDYADKISDNMGIIDTAVGLTQQSAIEMIIGDGTSSLATGFAGYIEVPHPLWLQAVRLFADTSGNIVIDIWKSTLANFPPTVSDSICGTDKPTLSSQQRSDANILTWTATEFARNEILAITIESVSLVKLVTLSFTGLTIT